MIEKYIEYIIAGLVSALVAALVFSFITYASRTFFCSTMLEIKEIGSCDSSAFCMVRLSNGATLKTSYPIVGALACYKE